MALAPQPRSDTPWDVAVIGAGPAGSMAARALAQHGHRVIVLDRRRFPREKACGDALIPDAIEVLRRNGLYDAIAAVAHPVRAVRVSSPSRVNVEIPGEFLCIKREALDHELVGAAVRAGATLVQGFAAAAREADDRVEIEVAGGESGSPVRARFALVATGADATLLRPLGMLLREEPSAVAVRAYVRSTYELETLVVSFDASIVPGYAWIFPLGSGMYNVGCGVFLHRGGADDVDLRAMLDRFLAQLPEARALLGASSEVGPVRGARLRCGLTGTRAWNGAHILAAGETLGATFPFTGEGIGKAMETAELAADAIGAVLDGAPLGSLAGYSSRLEQQLRPKYRGYEVAERWLSRPWLADLVARRARRSTRLRATLAGILGETTDPRAAFSVGGLARSMLP